MITAKEARSLLEARCSIEGRIRHAINDGMHSIEVFDLTKDQIKELKDLSFKIDKFKTPTRDDLGSITYRITW